MNPAATWRAMRHRPDLSVAVTTLLALLAWDASALDRSLIEPFASASGFAWRHHWLTQQVIHDGGRGLAMAVLAVLAVNVWRPWSPRLRRAEVGRALAATVVCLLAVPTFKRFSTTSCPWDQSAWGGVAQWVSHWSWGVADGGPGHCFPSGHAVAAFAFLSGFFLLRDAHPRAARLWLTAVLAVGTVFGAAQMVRGAHYASHTMWSAWLCWVICAVALARRQTA